MFDFFMYSTWLTPCSMISAPNVSCWSDTLSPMVRAISLKMIKDETTLHTIRTTAART